MESTENKSKTYNVIRGNIVWLKRDISINLGKNVQDIDRPYIVISNNINNTNDRCPIVNLACLSKKTDKAYYPMHVLINGKKYGMDFDSVIYVEQLITINKEMISDRVASLDDEDLKRLDRAIIVQLIDAKQPVLV